MALDLELIEEGENLNTEFKREFTEETKKTIIAFANTAGGKLYIGIDDDKSIIGVKNPDKTLLQITNTVSSAIKPDISMFIDYNIEKINNSKIIVVTVQKGTACPYYLAGKGIRPEGVYVRQGASSVPATEAAILNMIKETDGEKYEEVRSLNQDLTFNATKQVFREKNVSFGASQLKTLKIQAIDGLYTNLGLLLSEQSPHTVKVAVFKGLEKAIFQDRREFAGSLLKQLDEIYAYIEIQNSTFAEIRGLYRQEQRDYPEEALREALLNALIHRDYSFSSSILVSIFDDRIEFVSIGGLPKGVLMDDILIGLSVPRNENLAGIFYRLQLVEAYGMGIPKIMQNYNDYPRKPEIQITSNAFKITLPNRNFNSGKIIKSKASFNESEETILRLFKKHKEISRTDVETALEISQAMAVRLLRGLTDKGAIQVIGGGKNTRYTKHNTNR